MSVAYSAAGKQIDRLSAKTDRDMYISKRKVNIFNAIVFVINYKVNNIMENNINSGR